MRRIRERKREEKKKNEEIREEGLNPLQ